MFDAIARRYDLMNRVMSAGQDVRWRRAAVAALRGLPPGPLLDVGVGTGDLAVAMQRAMPRRMVAGIDLSAGMMRLARQKAGSALALVRADALRLPFPDASFAGVATAFTLRNVEGVDEVLAEVRRVLMPGGRFACLEITRPHAGAMAAVFRFYFHGVVPRVGAVVSGNPGAYRYLPASVERFLAGNELAAAMRRAGFSGVRVRRFWPGPVTLHIGVRRPDGAMETAR
jgi:demethylmenaquinone methyltransferase/2-methoxy-6-polyprenyl-1,4-benzoquinol methylase